MPLYQPAHDVQTEAGSGTDRFCREKRIEYPAENSFRYPGTVIDDAHDDMAAFMCRLDLNPAAVTRCVKRIIYQIGPDLIQFGTETIHERQFRFDLYVHARGLRFGLRSQDHYGVPEPESDVHRLRYGGPIHVRESLHCCHEIVNAR